MLLRLMSLQTDKDLGRWKNFEPRLDDVPPLAIISSNVPGGKLTFRSTLPDVDEVDSSDIPSAL